MKIINSIVYEGRNIHSHKKCIKLEVDLEGYAEIPSKDIDNFNDSLVELLPILYTHRCGIDEDGGFVKRLKEGTYLAHICEHMIIAMQNMLGIDLGYGKAREISGEIYKIVYQYQYKKTGIEVAKLAIDIINSLIEKKKINLDERLIIIKSIMREELIGPSALEVCNAAKEVGLPIIEFDNSGFYQIGYGKQGKIIESSISNNTSCVAADISCDKLLTKKLLSIQNLPVSKGERVYNVIDLLRTAERIGYPVVLKPEFGNKGNGVILNIKTEKELLKCYQKLLEEFKEIIVEKYYQGDDYRVCVVGNKVVAVSKRIPPVVVGDGQKTIKELIDEINSDELRGEDHEKPLTKIKVDEEVMRNLSENNYNLSSVLSDGEKVYIRKNSNLSTGGTAVDYTDQISDENKEICIRAAKTIGLDICGIDICTNDISKSLMSEGAILEVNAAPGLRMHTCPINGVKRDIGKEIINSMYGGNPKNIPVISITGTNGKTTTTRIISNTLSRMGYCVGMTSTEGIFIGDNCIDKGDDTGAESAKCVLYNRDVDVAVLETARGGIIKKGLAYDLADVAVITNITDDHLGVDNVNSMEELCSVKSLVAEAVKDDGVVVINADDIWSKKILDRIKSNIIYYSVDCNNELIRENIKNNGIAVYIKNNCINVYNRGIEHKVIDIRDIPITLNGILEFNIENAMAACAALVGLDIDYSMIKIGLEKFNIKDNQGRYNIYDYYGRNIILDYGHNIEGYKRVLPTLKEITQGDIIGVIGVPGDRSDYVAKEIGRISAKYLDRIIIKEDKEKRGRESGEVSELIKEGILSIDKNINVKVILDELEAFKIALNESTVGDSIIVFFENIDPLESLIKFNQETDEKLGNIANSN